MQDPTKCKVKAYPKDIDKLLELYKVADFYDLPKVKDEILEKVASNESFLRYTNVRRFVFEFLDETMSVELLSNPEIPIEVVCFVLTDPTINFINKDNE